MAGAAAMLPLLLLSAVVIEHWVSAKRSEDLQQVVRYAETLARGLDRELKSFVQTAEIIAGSEYLRRGDLASVEVLARDSVARVGGRIEILDRSGKVLVSTEEGVAAAGRRVTMPHIEAAVAAGAPMVSGLRGDTGSGRREFCIVAPAPKALPYVVRYVPTTDAIQQIVTDLVLPEGWRASVLDRHGHIVARSHDYRTFFGRTAEPGFLTRISSARGLIESVDLQAVPAYTAYQTSPASDWKVLVWAPKKVIDAPSRTALAAMLAAVLATALISLAAARVITRAIRKPVRQLVDAATALGTGATPQAFASRMAEANVIGAALHDASVRIAGREAELARSAARIREEAARYEELVGGLRDAVVWEGDPDALTFTFVSDAAEQLLGFPSRTWIDDATFWVDRLHEEDREATVAQCRRETAAGRSHELEYRMIAADGRVVWVRDNVYLGTRNGRRVSRGLIVDVTRWKTAEAVLRDNERRFREMTENAPVMIWMSDRNGRCAHLNRLLREFWDVPPEALEGFDWTDSLHPADADHVKETVAKAIMTRSSLAVEARYRNAAGEYRTLRTVATPRISPEGDLEGLLGVNIDITDMLRTSQAFRESEERLRIATNAAGLGVFEWQIAEDDARLENPRMLEILGLDPTRSSFSRRAFVTDHLHPDDVAPFEAALAAGIADGSTFRTTCRIRRRGDSAWRWIEIAGNFAGNDGKGASRLVGVVADITERKRDEEELVRSSALLRAVSDGARDLIFVKDHECRIIFANPAMIRALGRPSEQIIGSIGYEWAPIGSEIDGLLANDRRIMASGIGETVEETLTGIAGVRTYLSEKSPMRDADGRVVGLIGVSRDITERKRAEQQTHMLLREVSHRAKNMLAVAQAIVRQTSRDLDARTFAERVSARLAGLAASHDLLVESQWQGVPVDDLIEAQLAHLKDLIGTRIVLAGPTFEVQPSATQTLGMAIHELATNAAKYGALSNAEGTVALTWQLTSNGQGRRFVMSWEERGGPMPTPSPPSRGFGHSVLVRMIEHALDGNVTLEHRPTGLYWQVSAPARAVIEDDGSGSADGRRQR